MNINPWRAVPLRKAGTYRQHLFLDNGRSLCGKQTVNLDIPPPVRPIAPRCQRCEQNAVAIRRKVYRDRAASTG